MDKKVITVKRRCPICRGITEVEVYEDDYREFENSDKLIQDIFPYLSPSAREILITGICPTCWNNMFNEEE